METARRRGEDRRLIGEMLVERGLVSCAGLRTGLEEQRQSGGRLGYNLLRLGSVASAPFHLFLKDHLPALAPDLVEAIRGAPSIDLLPARLAYHYGMVPVRVEDGVLDLAVATADHPALLPAVEQLTGLRVEPIVCPPPLIAGALQRWYPGEIEPGVVFRAFGDHRFVISDARRGIRPLLPELVRPDAPSSDWLRAITAEAIRRGCRRILLEPHDDGARALMNGAAGDAATLAIPRGVYPGLARLIEGVSGMASRGRVVPRDGRVEFSAGDRRLAGSIRSLPGLRGGTFQIDLRVRRVRALGRDVRWARLPDLTADLDRMRRDHRGVLLIAGAGPDDLAAGADAVLDLLEDRLPVRASIGDWLPPRPGMRVIGTREPDEAVPIEAMIRRALEEEPDLLLLPVFERRREAGPILELALRQALIVPVLAADAFEAAEWVARSAHGDPRAAGAVVGIVASRLMERLCAECRHPFDPHDLLSPGPRHRSAGPGRYYVAQGCCSCRGSGLLDLEPVFEYIPGAIARSFQPMSDAAAMRDRCAQDGMTTLFHAGLQQAAAGAVDVREPLRLLLHDLS